MAHTVPTHAMKPRMGRSKARAVISPSHGIHLAAVALAYVTRTLAMDLLAMDLLRMRHGLA
jgi:hypothetical protein